MQNQRNLYCRECLGTQKHLDTGDFWVCAVCTTKLYHAQQPKIADTTSAMKVETESTPTKEDEKKK